MIPTLDAASDRVRACIAAVQATTDVAHEIVIIDNGCPPQGFASPVNAGVRAARTPYAVVMNDDVEPLPGWWPPLRAALDAGAPVSFPLTIDGPMRFDFAAWCFAMTSEAIDEFSMRPASSSTRRWCCGTRTQISCSACARRAVRPSTSRTRGSATVCRRASAARIPS